MPQDIQVIKLIDLHNLIKDEGPIHFISGGWECQSMSMAGKHLDMSDERFMPFLDMIRICNFRQVEQSSIPLYLFENTFPGPPGTYPLVDDTAKMVEAYLGAPIVLDAAGLGSAAHRVWLFWTNWCRPEILQAAIPRDKIPHPNLQQILHVDQESPMPNKTSISPFVKHNKLGKKIICMPTIASYPGSHAYRMQENGKPGEGQLWNKAMRRWDEPSLKEREQLRT